MKSNDNIAQLEAFLASVMVELQRSDLADCLAVWEAGSDEWEEGAMILFREELLKPLSQAVDSIRRYKQIEDYIELIPLIKEQKMVKRSEVFETLQRLREQNEEMVKRTLFAIYQEGDVWDLIDNALNTNNFIKFEGLVGCDQRATDLKKIVCHYKAVTESINPSIDATTLEEMKSIAKELLSICSKMMLTAKEEAVIKSICKNPHIENTLSFEGLRYYYRIREKRATIISEIEEPKEEPQQPTPSTTSEYYTRKEVIELFEICPQTLSNWNRRGIIKPLKMGERRVYYRRSDIDEYIKKRNKPIQPHLLYK